MIVFFVIIANFKDGSNLTTKYLKVSSFDTLREINWQTYIQGVQALSDKSNFATRVRKIGQISKV